ncbi:MAG: right-handed parallel beta-helix repeat-containing protein, partial [Thermoplasmata archaeon]|nr:right-handed parallel beta-helix repeat-containing protein [Thermoplasmata archaeon]
MLVSALLLLPIVPFVSDDVEAIDYLSIAEGETLVVAEDATWNYSWIDVKGTLVIDGAVLITPTMFPIIDQTLINVTGTLKVVNGSELGGYFTIEIQPGGVVEVHDSKVGSDWYYNPYLFEVDHGNLTAANSSLFNERSIIRTRGGNISLLDTDISHERPFETMPLMDLSDGTDLVMVGSNVSSESPVIECKDVGSITVRDCVLYSKDSNLLTIDGARWVTVSGTTFLQGSRGIVATDVRNLTVTDTRMEGQEGYGCQLSWLASVTIDGLSVKNCGDVALNITNCTNVTVTDVEVNGVSGDGIGIMSEHNGPFAASRVTVRYAQKGVFMIYTDEVTLEDINVDWCRLYGIQLSYCDGVDIRRLSATEAGVDGIYAAYCKGLRVEDASLDGAIECGAFLTHTPTTMTDVSARNCGQYGIRAAVQSTFLVRCDLSYNGLDGFLSLDQGGVGLTDCIAEGNSGNGTRFLNAGSPFLKGCRLAENRYAGVWVHYETRGAEVLGCDIEGNRWGVVLNGPTNLSSGSSVTVRDTYIHNNSEAGAFNWLDSTMNLDARYCWWGNNTGPYNETRNAEGSGDLIQGGVRFKPWLRLGNLPPIIKGPRDIVVSEEDVGLFFYSASDWDTDPNRIRFSLEGEPDNMTIDPLSGSLTVTPDDAEVGVWSFFITATDDGGAVGKLLVNLTVPPVNDPPEILVPEDGVP